MKHLLVLDFDNTITDWNDSLDKKRADEIAKRVIDIAQKHNMGIVILSVANKAHILHVVKQSKSRLLQKLFDKMPLVTEEYRTVFQTLDPRRKETEQGKNQMILQVMKNPKYTSNDEIIRAYKKTNFLLRFSKSHRILPDKIVFLDDNFYNIKFACHYGFKAYRVANQNPNKTIFAYFDKIDREFKFSLLKNREDGKSVRETYK